ncbi:MAG: type IV toxin-antitoxin system AbiEi family antitoxin domain-containing protein [Coriobacteriales bacterium]|jgi:predicted transcriptional regulator of viral defense system
MKKDELLALMKRRAGRITTRAARQAGYSNSLLTSLEADGAIELESRGVWALSDTPLDDFAVISLRWPRLIFSHDSALYLHGLADRAPSRYDVTCPQGYKAPAIFDEFPGIQVHACPLRLFDLGAIEGKSPTGTLIKLYDRERCICDLIVQRKRNKADGQTFAAALRGYMASKDRDLPKLARYAEKLGISRELRVYAEVLA